jgi:hypothetical protein
MIYYVCVFFQSSISEKQRPRDLLGAHYLRGLIVFVLFIERYFFFNLSTGSSVEFINR